VPSAVQKRSYGSVTVFWLDRERAVENLRSAAERLAEEKEEVLYVGLFGSLAEGRAVPGSDADLIVLVSSSPRRFLDRPLDYLPYFEGLGIGVDLFCYTPEEAAETPHATGALAKSVALWDRQQGR
jgi:predicted nucleotidyltransferase